MPTVALATLGCKVNLYESDRIKDGFESLGFTVVGADECADVYVVNTCSVTQVAESKSRKLVRRLSRQNPSALVVVTGCDVEMARLMGRDHPSGAMVVGNAAKLDVPLVVLERRPDLKPARTSERSKRAVRRTRAVVKVQDGCDMFCSYCSVPLTRGPVRSRSMSDILTEVREASAAGHREIVVAGVLVGAYGRDLGPGAPDLADVLREVCRVPGVARVRLSSIEPTHVTERLLSLASETPVFCPHLHLPLQSGDDGILAAMNRPYTSGEYIALCARARAALPDLGITTDVLVGFPGESPQAHAHSMALAREVGFARMHVFRYSRRYGTRAATLPDAIDEADKTKRAAQMNAMAQETGLAFARRYVGKAMEVIAEPGGRRDGQLVGYTPNYIRVGFAAGRARPGDLVRVLLTGAEGRAAQGEVVGIGCADGR